MLWAHVNTKSRCIKAPTPLLVALILGLLRRHPAVYTPTIRLYGYSKSRTDVLISYLFFSSLVLLSSYAYQPLSLGTILFLPSSSV